MNLGTLMTHLSHETDAAAALDALGDLLLLQEVTAMGERHDEAPGEYVANASRRFAAQAGDEDWLALMTAMERADDPGRAALDRMLQWALVRDATQTSETCRACGGGGGGCHGEA